MNMELAVFISKHSDQAAAELFDVPERTVASWRRLERAPKPTLALEIIRKTGGVVSWEGIYRPFACYRARLKKRRKQEAI